ncbi:hypothetical protein N752_09240 [Desulforamulus aquiferis]|nr:hypothetical protein N752_09240 [Desulforamulus aquiferis]
MLKRIKNYVNNITDCVSLKKAGISAMLGILTVTFLMPAPGPATKKPEEISLETKAAENKEQVEIQVGAIEPMETRNTREPQISRGNLNRNEVILLAMVIEGEAADEPYKGKVAVGQ